MNLPFSLDDEIKDASSIGIAGHVRPDGDCVGSTLAVYNYIREYFPDKEVHVYIEPIPNKFKFLKNADKIEDATDNPVKHDVFIACDCSDGSRLGKAFAYFEAADKTICIDHHLSNGSFADLNYIIPDDSSASELVYNMICHRQVTREIAECIYTGIINDTGVFQYSATTPDTMKCAAALMATGIDFPSIVSNTFYTKTYHQTKVMAHAILKSVMHLNDRVITSFITREEMEEFHVAYKELDGIAEQLRNVRDVDVSVFLYENEDGSYKASTRASGDAVNLAIIAEKFGGGGHAKAAGFTMNSDPITATYDILDEIEKQLK